MSAHARLSPSAAESWMTCAKYPAAIQGLPDETSQAAAEGTAAHQIADDCLALGLDAYHFIGTSLKVKTWSFEWTDEDADLLQSGIDQTREFAGQFYGEHQVDLSHWLGDDQFGTLDRGIVSDDLIIVSDLKWGRGIAVSPVRNKQLMLYALGFWWNVARHVSKATDFLLIIDQPRCSAGGGEWRTTLDELLAFGEEARAAAIRTNDPLAAYSASAKGCLWCARRKTPQGCQTYDTFCLEMFDLMLEDLDVATDELKLPTGMTPERRSNLLAHKGLIEKWLEQHYAQCIQDALCGDPTPGMKVVSGKQGPRKWTDKLAAETEVVSVLGDRAHNKKLITPTQVAKLVSEEAWKAISEHVERSDPKPILVPEDDARPALVPFIDGLDDLD